MKLVVELVLTGLACFGAGVFCTVKYQATAMAELQSLRNSAASAIKGK